MKKIKPGSFQDRAKNRVHRTGERDLKKIWNEEVELNPDRVNVLQDSAAS
jgi:hypothetical protein